MTEEEQLAIPPTPLEVAELLTRATEVKWAGRLGAEEVMFIRRLAFDRDRLEAEIDKLRMLVDSLRQERQELKYKVALLAKDRHETRNDG